MLASIAEKVVTLAGALSNAGEHRETIMPFCDIVDELLDKHGLSHTGTAEQTNLTTLRIRFEEVDHLDTGEHDLRRDGKVLKFRRGLMDRTQILAVERREHVDRLAEHVQQTAFHLISGRNGNRMPEVLYLYAAANTIGALHGHTPHDILADVLFNLEDQLLAVVALHLQSRIDRRNVFLSALKRDVDYRTDNLGHRTKNFAHIFIFTV